MPLDLTDDKSTLVQVMAWCRQATSHYLSQWWLSSLSPYGITRPIWWRPPGLQMMTWITCSLTGNIWMLTDQMTRALVTVKSHYRHGNSNHRKLDYSFISLFMLKQRKHQSSGLPVQWCGKRFHATASSCTWKRLLWDLSEWGSTGIILGTDGLGQWEKALHSNTVSHWPSPYSEWPIKYLAISIVHFSIPLSIIYHPLNNIPLFKHIRALKPSVKWNYNLSMLGCTVVLHKICQWAI